MIKTGIAFVVGCGVGGIATYLYLKPKYEKIAQDEINAYKEAKNAKNQELATKAINKPDISKYTELASNYKPKAVNVEVERSKTDDTPTSTTIISPDEVGMNEDYDTVTYTYFVDGTIANEFDEVVTESNILDMDISSHFGEYEDDAVYIRDDALKLYYEILYDYRSFEEYIDAHPEKRLDFVPLEEDSDEE